MGGGGVGGGGGGRDANPATPAAAAAAAAAPSSRATGPESGAADDLNDLNAPASLGLLLRGVGVGLLGAALRPLSGALGLVAHTATSLQDALAVAPGDPAPQPPISDLVVDEKC